MRGDLRPTVDAGGLLTDTERLSAARLLAYAAPTVALQAMLVPLYNFLPPVYYAPEVGMAVGTVGLMFALGRFWEALTDPLIGALSDRTRSRFGRRRVWMAIGTPISLVSAYFLLLPPAAASPVYLLGWLIVFYLGWTMVYIPHQTWGSELATGYHERTRIAGFRESGAFVGYLAATLAGIFYWQWFVGVSFPSYAQIVQSAGVFFAIALPLFVLWCFAAVPPTVSRSETTPGWGELLALVRRNKPFARLIGAYFVDRLAMGTYFAAQPILISQALGLQQHVLTVAVAITISSVLFAPAWVPVARRLGKHRTYCLANIVTALAYVSLFFIPAGLLWPVLLANIVMGCGNGGTMIMPAAMTADAVDHDELQSGVQQTGGHMAFLAMVFKAGMGFGAFIGLTLLGLVGYVNLAQTLDADLERSVRFTAAWLPALLLLVPITMMWRYPLDATRHGEIRRRLEARADSPSAATIAAVASTSAP